MIIRTSAERPMKLPIVFPDREVIDAGDAQPHQAMFVECPVLVAVTAEPIAAVVAPFVGEAHGNTVIVKCPQLLDEPVVELTSPLAAEKSFDRASALEELNAVSPAAADRVGERDASGIARIPRVLGQAHLLRGGFGRKRRKWRSTHHRSPSPKVD